MDTTTHREATTMSTEEKTAGKRLDWDDCPGVERDPGRRFHFNHGHQLC